MRKSWFFPLLVCVLFSFVQTSFAQRQAPNRSDLIALSGDPDTFGANMKFAGVVHGGYVVLDATCVWPPGEGLGPDDRCVVLNAAPAQTSFDFRDVGRITLPANSTKDVLFQMATVFRNFQFHNTTGSAQDKAIMAFSPYLTIESEALNDPRALNPETGLPLNGTVDISLSMATLADRSLAVNERIREQVNYSRTAVNGLSRSYWRSWGFSEDLIQKLLQGQLTIRLNVKGRAKLVSDGFFQLSVRFFGN